MFKLIAGYRCQYIGAWILLYRKNKSIICKRIWFDDHNKQKVNNKDTVFTISKMWHVIKREIIVYLVFSNRIDCLLVSVGMNQLLLFPQVQSSEEEQQQILISYNFCTCILYKKTLHKLTLKMFSFLHLNVINRNRSVKMLFQFHVNFVIEFTVTSPEPWIYWLNRGKFIQHK